MLPCGNGFRGSINPIRIYRSKRRVSAFLIDEIILQIGSNNEAWIWVAIELIHKQILEFIFKTQEYDNCRERHLFLSSLISIYGDKHTIYSDGGGTWYPEACVSLGLKRRLHASYEIVQLKGRS